MDKVACWDWGEPESNIGRDMFESCVEFEDAMPNSSCRMRRKSSAVAKSPGVPATCGCLVKSRETVDALVLFGMDL